MWKIKKQKACGNDLSIKTIYCTDEYETETDAMRKMFVFALDELNEANKYEHEVAENYENRYYIDTNSDEHDIIIIKVYHGTGETCDIAYYDLVKDVKIMEVSYVYHYHMNYKVWNRINEINDIIKNHDWESFKKWLEWEKKQPVEYFPKIIYVTFDGEYEREIELNEHNFKTITFVENECG